MSLKCKKKKKKNPVSSSLWKNCLVGIGGQTRTDSGWFAMTERQSLEECSISLMNAHHVKLGRRWVTATEATECHSCHLRLQ